MQQYQTPAMEYEVQRRIERLRPLEQQLLNYLVCQHQRDQAAANQAWLQINFAEFKALLGTMVPDDLASQYLIKSLETLLYTRGYYQAIDHASIEYQLIAGYRINPDQSCRIYFNKLILPILRKQFNNYLN